MKLSEFFDQINKDPLQYAFPGNKLRAETWTMEVILRKLLNNLEARKFLPE
jgi:hypothetical protein